jgi:uncharacterized protein (DUF1800 family)
VTSETAIAANRIGLGIRPDSPPSGKAANWLSAQIDRFNPRPATLAALPTRATLIQSLQDLKEMQRAKKDQAKDADTEADTAMAENGLKNYRKALRDHYSEAVDARLQTAVASQTDFAERLVHFWANHFAVSTDKVAITALAGNYEFDAIRPHIFGKFSDLLNAAVKHPTMLLYLDQAQSIGPDSTLAQRVNARRDADLGLNENLAREILELHTLGVRTVYTQEDVTEFARALTGHTVTGLARGPINRAIGAGKPAGETVFVDAIHQPGTRRVIGTTYAQPGAGQANAILSNLATHRATAKHIAVKLATHFVADTPPPTLVAKLETDFLKTGGDLKSLYRTLLNAPETWAAGQSKFKTPWEWTVSALRALNLNQLGKNKQGAAALFVQMGQPIWRPGSPAGFADSAKDWAGPAALMRRVETAGRFARLTAGRVDARALAPTILPGTLDPRTAEHIARAESPEQGLALLLVAPEFLRR